MSFDLSTTQNVFHTFSLALREMFDHYSLKLRQPPCVRFTTHIKHRSDGDLIDLNHLNKMPCQILASKNTFYNNWKSAYESSEQRLARERRALRSHRCFHTCHFCRSAMRMHMIRPSLNEIKILIKKLNGFYF